MAPGAERVSVALGRPGCGCCEESLRPLACCQLSPAWQAASSRTLCRVTLRFYDTAARTVREFVPVTAGKASLYLCGATVQAPPHIGHIRSGVGFDILVRWLKASGYQTTFCRNVTDIDDKIIRVAAAEEVPWWQVAQRNERAFSRAYDALGCLPPDVEPRATGHVPEMIILMRRLIDSGHAYAAGGDVYFDVSSYPGLRRAVRPASRAHAGRRRHRRQRRQTGSARLRPLERREAR